MSRVNVRIRPADVPDVPALVALIRTSDLISGQFSGRALLDDTAEHLTERLTQILRDGSRQLLVAVDEAGAVAGLLAARVDDVGTIDLTPVLHVTHLIVAPAHRRRGVGRTLLAAVVHLADERGIERVLATASAGSREANRYLARLGFAPLVVHRIASTSVLRRSLGLAEAPERMAVLRRARLLRAQRAGITRRAAGHGA
jgi:ribosomal protein S18 acetylase RimI-like enzyme